MTIRFESGNEIEELLKRNPDVRIEDHLTKPDKKAVKNNPVLDTLDPNEHFGKVATGITWQQWQDKAEPEIFDSKKGERK